MLPIKRQHVLVLADEVVIDNDLGQIGSHHFLVVIVIAVVQLGDHHTATTMLGNVLKAALGPMHLLHTLALFVLDHHKIFLVLDLCQATVSFTFDHFTVSIVRLLELFVIFVHQRPHEVFKFDSLVFQLAIAQAPRVEVQVRILILVAWAPCSDCRASGRPVRFGEITV